MTDLDRKIAEMKGWEFSATGFCAVNQEGEHIGLLALHLQDSTPFGWSTDIVKAFGLVEEIRTGVLRYQIKIYTSPSGLSWHVELSPVFVNGNFGDGTWGGVLPTFEGDDLELPEAICRAYIALKEWERARR